MGMSMTPRSRFIRFLHLLGRWEGHGSSILMFITRKYDVSPWAGHDLFRIARSCMPFLLILQVFLHVDETSDRGRSWHVVHRIGWLLHLVVDCLTACQHSGREQHLFERKPTVLYRLPLSISPMSRLWQQPWNIPLQAPGQH